MPKDGSVTRTRILDAAEGLVERNGFAATSVDQILAASGSSKGAFFHHFDSKRALASALVDRYVDADLTQLRRGLDAADGIDDPVERVLAFLAHYERWADELVSEDSACLYIAVLTERDLLDDATSASVERAIRTWREEFAALLRPALGRPTPWTSTSRPSPITCSRRSKGATCSAAACGRRSRCGPSCASPHLIHLRSIARWSDAVHVEWGPQGAARATAGGLLVVVDVLSFTTSVSVCVERGTQVYPAAWQDRRAGELAERVGAVLATGRRAATPDHPWSLSPAALRAAPAPARLVLPSPNGSAIAAAAPPGVTVVAGCLRNATAVGRRVARAGAGHRRPGGRALARRLAAARPRGPAGRGRGRRRAARRRTRPRAVVRGGRRPRHLARHAPPRGRRPRVRLRPGTGARRVRRRRRDRRRARRERRGARAGRGRLQARRLMLITYGEPRDRCHAPPATSYSRGAPLLRGRSNAPLRLVPRPSRVDRSARSLDLGLDNASRSSA